MGNSAVDETVYVYTPFYIPHRQSPSLFPSLASAISEPNTESRMERTASPETYDEGTNRTFCCALIVRLSRSSSLERNEHKE